MSRSPSFWVWFPVPVRWVSASAAGARRLFVDCAQDVAWGRMPPTRPGSDASLYDPLFRANRWDRFFKLTVDSPNDRHRISCC